MTLTIRPSGDEDVAALTAIYAHHVLNGTGTFETEPPSAADMAARRADVLGKNLPYLVAEENGEVLGFAYCNWFKPRPAYRFSAEDSIYMSEAARGKGLGAQLLHRHPHRRKRLPGHARLREPIPMGLTKLTHPHEHFVPTCFDRRHR